MTITILVGVVRRGYLPSLASVFGLVGVVIATVGVKFIKVVFDVGHHVLGFTDVT